MGYATSKWMFCNIKVGPSQSLVLQNWVPPNLKWVTSNVKVAFLDAGSSKLGPSQPQIGSSPTPNMVFPVRPRNKTRVAHFLVEKEFSNSLELHHDNASSHTARRVRDYLAKHNLFSSIVGKLSMLFIFLLSYNETENLIISVRIFGNLIWECN